MLQPKPKKAVKKYVPTAQEKKNLEDASKNKNMRPPFTSEERKKMPKVGNMGSAKNGKAMKKAKNGTSLGMKSVKAGFDKNPGVTRADIIVAGKKEAKKGATVKKAKSGTSMKKCKYGCK